MQSLLENPRNCWQCHGDRWFTALDGETKECRCWRWKVAERRLGDVKPNLTRVKPRGLYQAKALREIRLKPDGCYFFHGPNGTGKTYFSHSLLRVAVCDHKLIYSGLLREWVTQYRKWDVSNGVEPLFTLDNLRSHKGEWTIFFDEFDKIKPTEYTGEVVFSVLEAILTTKQQLIIAANLDFAGLQSQWKRLDDVWASSIIRRLGQLQVIKLG